MILLVALLTPAHANGQTTHIWITRDALSHLPEGDLRQLLTRDDMEDALVAGAMFPDGGYAVSHPFGEAAHWESFQNRYRDWIASEYPAPYSDDGASHVAFLMGMASHGMADQVFDAVFMERSKVYDADYGWADGESMDEATDVVWAALTEPQTHPDEPWIPEIFPELFAQQGIDVDAETLSDAQDLLGLAVDVVGYASGEDDLVANYTAQFPWAAEHLHDDTPGAPPCEGEVVALYWEAVWDRLQGTWTAERVVATIPPHGSFGHETDASMVESRFSLVVGGGLDTTAVAPEGFRITAEDGAEIPLYTWLFYRDDSHVIHLIPQQDLAEDTDYTITALAGLTAQDGSVLAEDRSWVVSTRPPPAEDTDSGAPTPPEPTPCGCRSGPSGPSWIMWLALGLLRRRRG